MPTGYQYDYNKIVAAIRTAHGKITLAAQIVGCRRETIYEYAKKYKTVQSAIDESRLTFDEGLLDLAEAKLRGAILNDESWAIKYALDKKGAKLGYMDAKRHEITGKDGDAMTFKLIFPDSE